MARPGSLPMNVDIVAYANTDLVREFRWRPNGTDPQDFTGWSGELRIGTAKAPALLELSTADAALGLSADGIITMHLSPAATAALQPAELIYILDLTDTSGIKMRFLRGSFTVIHELSSAP